MKNFWNKRKYWQRGLLVGLVLEVSLFVCYLAIIVFSYDGTCGGLFPALAGPVECTLLKHLDIEFGWMSILIAEFGYMLWGVLALFLACTTFAGFVFGRFVKR